MLKTLTLLFVSVLTAGILRAEPVITRSTMTAAAIERLDLADLCGSTTSMETDGWLLWWMPDFKWTSPPLSQIYGLKQVGVEKNCSYTTVVVEKDGVGEILYYPARLGEWYKYRKVYHEIEWQDDPITFHPWEPPHKCIGHHRQPVTLYMGFRKDGLVVWSDKPKGGQP